MNENDQDLAAWIQEHAGITLSANLVATLRKLHKNNKNSKQGFVTGCNAIGRLRGKEKLLLELFERLATENKELHETESLAIRSTGNVPSRASFKIGKKQLPINFDHDIEDDEDLLEIPAKNIKHTLEDHNSNNDKDDFENTSGRAVGLNIPRTMFKRINKDVASKLKEYSSSKRQETPVPSKSKGDPQAVPTALRAPKLQSYYVGDTLTPQGRKKDTKDFGKSSESETSGDDIDEDRSWYDHDDDYGNPVKDESVATSELDFELPKKNYNFDKNQSRSSSSSGAEIQVYALPMSKRKELIPDFLKRYIESHGVSNDIVIGSFLRSSQEGFTNPFKNPEGSFAVNARKGSKLVAMRRLAKDQNDSSKQTAEIAGTSVGNVLGIKENNSVTRNAAGNTTGSHEVKISRSEIEESRRRLPAYGAKQSLIQMIRDNQISVIIGETGSGKTTQLSQYLYEAGLCGDNMIIGCTQPRRVAAMSVAKRVALEMDVKLGQEVGYAIRFEDETSSATKIKFMTDGILLREALLDENLEKYSCIIIDEAHERSLNTDIILGIIKRLLSRRRDLKLVITSATMNAAKFSQFFGSAPLFTIPGRTFPQKLIYTKSPVEDYVEAAVMQAVSIHISTEIDSGDILIFMTGQEDIEATSDIIRQKLTEVYSRNSAVTTFNDIDNIEIFMIYSALPGDVQNRIFERLPTGKRKLVIATNIAETSLTIDGIRYVIDCGYSKLKVYNPRIGLDSLAITPISRANADQRSGRASRTAPGTTYRLYTEDTVDEDMFAQAIPEIQRTNLSNTVLLLKSLGVENIMDFPFIDAPPLQTLLASLYELFFIGALSVTGELTSLGVEMSKFPLQPSLCKILLVAAQNGCSEEMLTIVSMLSVPQVFYRPKERMKESDIARRRFFVAESDHLTLLNVFSQWKSNRYSHRWCSKHFLHYKSLQRAREIREQLEKILYKQGIKLISSGHDWDIVRKCVCSGFAHQSAKRAGLGKYVHLKTGMDIKLHPTSALYGMGDLPPYVVYHELLMTKTEYICCVTSVDPFWLMEYGGLLYDIRRVRYANDSHVTGDSSSANGKSGNFDDEPDDELDEKLKKCLIQRNSMISCLKAHNQPTIKELKSTANAITKRNKIENVQFGFKRRRPF